MKKPLLVAVEGIDGSGKTTLIKRLTERLEHEARLPCRSFAWFDDPRYHRITRVFNLSGAMTPGILAAIHACHTEALLRDANRCPCAIQIFDRYIFSSYAACVIRGESKSLMHELLAGFPRPELTVFLKATSEECYERVLRRGNMTFYEGVDRLFGGSRRAEFLDRFAKGEISESLIKELFVQTMDEWNRLFSEEMSGVPHVTVASPHIGAVDSICDDLVDRITSIRSAMDC